MLRWPPDLKPRISRLNRRHVKAGRAYVLCWLQQAIRGSDNPIIDAAVAAGNQLGIPVVVYHGIDNRYPFASHRLHRFLLEASQSLEMQCEDRSLRFCRYVRRSDKLEEGLVYRLCESAACLFTDDLPTFVARNQARSVSKRVDVPVFIVDAARLVPKSLFSADINTTKAFRAAHRPQRERWINTAADIEATIAPYSDPLGFSHDSISGHSLAKLDKLIGQCDVDMTLPPVAAFPGNREAGQAYLSSTIEHVVSRYKWVRNNPALEHSTSKLSPFMHFGVLGPREVVRQIEASDLPRAALWKFFDELLTWREYYHHISCQMQEPSAWSRPYVLFLPRRLTPDVGSRVTRMGRVEPHTRRASRGTS